MVRSLLAAALADVAAGHGQMTYPTSRSGSNLNSAGGCPDLTFSNGHDYCAWNIDGVTHPGAETISADSPLITTDVNQGNDWTQRNPWRAPGTTPLPYPCGKIAGQDGRDYPPTERTTVQAGGTLEVGWALNANHGGGTIVRLCPADSDLSEECFQRTILKATRGTSWIQDGSDKSSRREIPAMRTTQGTYPTGSEWTRNPIPDREYFFTPPLGLYGHGPFTWNIIDEYAVPADIASGDYALSWRWDCEETEQVWANCADITVVGGGPPTPPPPSPPAPPPTPAPSPVPVPAACNIPDHLRKDCGHVGTQQPDCEASGCCWVPGEEGSATPWCFYPETSGIAI